MKDALKLALEALERVNTVDDDCDILAPELADAVVEAITAIKKALAQPDYRAVKTYHEGKPVYVSQPEQELEYCVDYHCAGDCGQPHNQQERQAFLVAQPLQRPWVGLNDKEIEKCYETTGHRQTLRLQDRFAVFSLARAVQIKLKEKNT